MVTTFTSCDDDYDDVVSMVAIGLDIYMLDREAQPSPDAHTIAVCLTS